MRCEGRTIRFVATHPMRTWEYNEILFCSSCCGLNGAVNCGFQDNGLTGREVSLRMRALRSLLTIFSFRKCHENIFRKAARSPA